MIPCDIAFPADFFPFNFSCYNNLVNDLYILSKSVRLVFSSDGWTAFGAALTFYSSSSLHCGFSAPSSLVPGASSAFQIFTPARTVQSSTVPRFVKWLRSHVDSHPFAATPGRKIKPQIASPAARSLAFVEDGTCAEMAFDIPTVLKSAHSDWITAGDWNLPIHQDALQSHPNSTVFRVLDTSGVRVCLQHLVVVNNSKAFADRLMVFAGNPQTCLSVDVTEYFRKRVPSGGLSLMLRVCRDSGDIRKVYDLKTDETGELVLSLIVGMDKPAVLSSEEVHYRRRRATEDEILILHTVPLEPGKSQGNCAVQPWYVTWAEVDMHYVVEPKVGYWASYCGGKCPVPLGPSIQGNYTLYARFASRILAAAGKFDSTNPGSGFPEVHCAPLNFRPPGTFVWKDAADGTLVTEKSEEDSVMNCGYM